MSGYKTWNVNILSRADLEQQDCFVTTYITSFTGARKLLRYQFHKLIQVTALSALFVRGSLFNLSYSLYMEMIIYVGMYLSCLVLVSTAYDPLEFEDRYLKECNLAAKQIQQVLPFLFGLFASFMLARWWMIRTKGIGAVFTYLVSIVNLLSAIAGYKVVQQADWERLEVIQAKIVRYGVSSLACVAFESRKAVTEESLNVLVEIGLLTAEEMRLLVRHSGRSAAFQLWAWVCALTGEALEMMMIAPPIYNSLFSEILCATDGIHRIIEFLVTQVPFPYVHAVTLFVNVNCCVISSMAGVETAIQYTKGAYASCFPLTFQIFVVPLIFQALLQACVYLSDPMGDDLIDFPIFESAVYACEGYASVSSVRDLYLYRRRTGLSPCPNVKDIPVLERPKEPPARNCHSPAGEKMNPALSCVVAPAGFTGIEACCPKNSSVDVMDDIIPEDTLQKLDKWVDRLTQTVSALQSSMDQLQVQLLKEGEIPSEKHKIARASPWKRPDLGASLILPP